MVLFCFSSYDFPENPNPTPIGNLNNFGNYQVPHPPTMTMPYATMQPAMMPLMPPNTYSYASPAATPYVQTVPSVPIASASVKNYNMNDFNRYMQEKKEEFFKYHLKNNK